MMKKILVLNGSPSGQKGNCAKLITLIQKSIKGKAKLTVVHLADCKSFGKLEVLIKNSDGFILTTGTYWDSWGSPLQWFLEQLTVLEATPALMGKPAATFVLMHSVGGKSVLSRLQGVLSTMGLFIPPMSGMVYSLVNHVALKSKTSHAKDLWQLSDMELILENLLVACEHPLPWKTWPVDTKNPRRLWL